MQKIQRKQKLLVVNWKCKDLKTGLKLNKELC